MSGPAPNNTSPSSPPLDLLVAAAVAFELRPFAVRLGVGEPLPELAQARGAAGSIGLLRAGMGRAGDSAFAAALRRHRPAAVLNVGIAGALDRTHPAGSTWIVEEWRDATHPHAIRARADAALSQRTAAALEAAGIDWGRATAVTVDDPLHDAAARDRLREGAAAHLVEMEGAAWATLAAAAGIPFAAVRVVSDHADRPLPGPQPAGGSLAWLLRDDGSVRRARLGWAWLVSGAWLRPRRSGREIRAAGRAFATSVQGLEAVAAALLPPPRAAL